MQEIYQYLGERNAMRVLFKQRKLRLYVPGGGPDHSDLRTLAAYLEGDLSPENLTMDGELSRDVVAQRHAYLIAVARQIKQLNPSITFWELDHV